MRKNKFYQSVKFILIDNYFWYLTIDAIILLVSAKSYLGTLVTPFMLYYLAIKSKIHYSNILINSLIILIWVSVILSWVINTYDYQGILAVRYIWSDLSFMMAYYIGCSMSQSQYHRFFDNMMIPVALLSILGLIFFIHPPGWYIERAITDDGASLESLRLKSVFPSPYTLSYISSVLLTYIFFQIVQNKKTFKEYRWFILIMIITVLLCMQRAPMGGVVIGIIGALYYGIFIKKKYVLLYKSVFGGFIITIMTIFLFSKLDTDMIQFLSYKIATVTSKDNDFLDSRYNISYMEVQESMLGHGAGRYAAWAHKYHSYNMADGQYKKISQEQGYFGEFLYVSLFLLVVLKCLSFRKELSFELCVMTFLMLSMIGANPFSNSGIHSMVWWLIIGRVSSYKPNNKRSNSEQQNEKNINTVTQFTLPS